MISRIRFASRRPDGTRHRHACVDVRDDGGENERTERRRRSRNAHKRSIFLCRHCPFDPTTRIYEIANPSVRRISRAPNNVRLGLLRNVRVCVRPDRRTRLLRIRTRRQWRNVRPFDVRRRITPTPHPEALVHQHNARACTRTVFLSPNNRVSRFFFYYIYETNFTYKQRFVIVYY